MSNLTPKQIVAELDKYIIGQDKAKKCVAVALRNRYRRQQLSSAIQDEISPKNIIMIGPTGVGKTEIARRLAKLVDAPFIKVEATKFTEIGYVGRDVESIVKDLVETSIRMVKVQKTESMKGQAAARAEERILELLVPKNAVVPVAANPFSMFLGNGNEPIDITDDEEEKRRKEQLEHQRQWTADRLHRGELEQEMVDIDIDEKTAGIDILGIGGSGMEELGMNIQEMLENIMPKKTKKRKVSVSEARKILIQEEAEKLVDMDEVISLGIDKAEQGGIVFLDEIDKIAVSDASHGIDVSRGGVQRDILPIVEGSTIMTKYGPVKTDFILFIAAGAFHVAKPSDLIPELQGRFPIRVELDSLTYDDFRRILLEPKNSLIKQYKALLMVDGVQVNFTDDGIDAIAEMADKVNNITENIGARRLHTILEKVLEDLLYEAPEKGLGVVDLSRDYVEKKLGAITEDEDLSRYIL